MTPCNYVNLLKQELIVHDFAVSDNKGRNIGFAVRRYTEDAVTRSAGSGSLCKWLGTHYKASFTTLRDGVSYGALTSDADCQTAQELEVEISRRIAVARKNASKK